MSMIDSMPRYERVSWSVPEFDQIFWRGRTSSWCVVVPVINEGQRIADLVERMSFLNIGDVADIIIVDGGSTDGSLLVSHLESMGVRGLLLKTGAGKLSAQLRCAYAFALDHGYAGIITIDGNNKDDPAAIPVFIKALEDKVDFVQASRFISGGMSENTPKLRECAIHWIHAPMLSFFSGMKWTDTTQGFRAYSARVLMDSAVAPFRDVFSAYELLPYMNYRVPRLGYICKELPTTRRYPAQGRVPTKISAVWGNLNVLSVLIKACLGQYNPGMK